MTDKTPTLTDQELETLAARARQATSTLRDFARTHGMGFRERDPLVLAVHDALDKLSATLTAEREQAERAEQELGDYKKALELRTHQVITCGVFAHHSDIEKVKHKKCYAETWATAQSLDVLKLREERDALVVKIGTLRAGIDDALGVSGYDDGTRLSIVKATIQSRDAAVKVAGIRQRKIDIPTAWELTLATPPDQHHEKCSYRVASMLCDCAACRVMEHVSGLLRQSDERAKQAEAALTAERERADRAERERDKALWAHHAEGERQRQRAESAEAENARLREALEAIIREITDDNANDRNALGSCIEVVRIAKEALTPTTPTGETR
jgi:hypothetical protein